MKHIFTITAFAAAFGLLATTGVQAQTKPAKHFGQNIEVAKCGITQYEKALKKKDPKRATTPQFEQWIATKIAEAKIQQRTHRSTNSVVTIPVVVHVIHNGDPIGTDENLAEAQILSQIQVLNEDFRRQAGTPGFNNNPVGADMEIEFCLAQRDPAGLNSSGIIRYDLGSEDSWDMEDVEVLKTQTQWDPTKYLNIWTVNQMTIGGIFEVYGYAQFPEGSGLEGLEEEGMPVLADTDGVVIAAYCFGSEDIYPAGYYLEGNNKGRTSTHEIGHFFGLRHIWGDETDCTGNDYCDDTPVAADANDGCPDAGWDSCPNSPGDDMIQNYMDYTNDGCKNIFTLDQKERMMAVVANSPRRASLTTSNGCTPGQVFNNDGSLNIQGIDPGCGSTFSPELVLKNTGNTVMTTALITYNIDGQANTSYNWEGNLTNGQQTIIDLPEFTAASGSHTFNVAIATVNGSEDQAPTNDHKSQTFTIVPSFNTTEVIITIMTDGFGDETVWAITDSDENPLAGNIDPIAGEIVFYGNNELHTETVQVVNGECYMFGIFDIGGDGICCEYGDGYYRVETANGTVIAEGGQFGQQMMIDFRIDTTMGIGGTDKTLNGISLYPNPANSQLNITLPQTSALPDGYTVYNSLGQMMDSGKFASATQALNISGYANGVYFVKVASGESTKTLQFIKY